MKLVEDDALQVREQELGARAGEQQRELLGGGEQDVGRGAALAGALAGRGVAGPRLDADRQAHLGDRDLEVAGDVDRECLQRRDVERVQARLAARRGRELDEARQEARERLAGTGRRDQQRRATGLGMGEERELMGARRPAATREPGEEGGREGWTVEHRLHLGSPGRRGEAREAGADHGRRLLGIERSREGRTRLRSAAVDPGVDLRHARLPEEGKGRVEQRIRRCVALAEQETAGRPGPLTAAPSSPPRFGRSP